MPSSLSPLLSTVFAAQKVLFTSKKYHYAYNCQCDTVYQRNR